MAEPTIYVILARQDEGAWHPIGEQAARSAEAAVRASVGGTEGTYKAIPYRSWKHSVTVTVETKIRVSTLLTDE